MKQITCPHCADTYPDFDVAHVCSRGPYAPKLKPKTNERILELADKAIEDMPGSWNIPDEFCKKFAELIVKECLEELRYTVLDTQELRRDKSTDYQVGWEDGMFDAGETIKNIFGVEE